jgi:DNA adenine methylase
MKPPIKYYGGKQTLVKEIDALRPNHYHYVEPFLGGGAYFWHKEPSNYETINDINDNVHNFYITIRDNFQELKNKIDGALHSRKIYKDTKIIYNNPGNYDNVTRAYALWCQCIMSFGGAMNRSGWAYIVNNLGQSSKITYTYKKRFVEELSLRVKPVQIECRDAIEVIKTFDSPSTWFYLDPPYTTAEQGCYKIYGWNQDRYKELLELLSNLKGMFVLSEYDSEILNDYRKTNKWNAKSIQTYSKVNNKSGIKERKPKIETLTWNYDIENKLFN